ncbi:MAG: hypothetical protein CMM46_06630 [Rhodospirillaceae bacterium]|nr:hypothetical protein [Rhodospirillaceae bacterium]|tara:strand:+ start:996 stop:1538 length:543 start_codon:yes stop_codon:yes gene_type:complete
MTSCLTRWRFLPVLALLFVLAACGGEEEVVVLTCPQVLIVDEASRLTQYAPGDGRDMLDIRYDAKIGTVEWVCEFHAEENRVDVEVRFGVLALRGPAAESSVARLPYFVAVADPQGEIMAKQVFAIESEFPGNALEIGHVETVFQHLHYASLSQAQSYTVYIGFQLTPKQLQDVRAGAGF